MFLFPQEMEQIEEEKRHKNLVTIIKSIAEVAEEMPEEEDISMDSLDNEELRMNNAIRFQKEEVLA